MARKEFSEDERVSTARASSARAEFDIGADGLMESGALDPIDGRVLDLEPEQESPFLRAQKRVPVRRGPLPKKTVNKLKIALVALGTITVVFALGAVVYRYGRSSWRFRLDSSDQVHIAGNHNVTRAQAMGVFGQDISRNVFAIPLADRKSQLERIPWVESATVMRLLPNRLSVDIRERMPVAVVQIGSRILLADASGVVMEMPGEGQQQYSFPVIVGMAEAEPLSKRAASVRIYLNLLHDLDANGANYSRDMDEVDLSDPEDVKVTVTDPQGQVLIHLGSGNFLERYKMYVAHAQEWRQQFQHLDSVDLRYDRQVIVNPDMPRGAAAAQSSQPASTMAAPAAKSGTARPHALKPPAHKRTPRASAHHKWAVKQQTGKAPVEITD